LEGRSQSFTITSDKPNKSLNIRQFNIYYLKVLRFWPKIWIDNLLQFKETSGKLLSGQSVSAIAKSLTSDQLSESASLNRSTSQSGGINPVDQTAFDQVLIK
jgi:hypothetical protein